MIPKNNDMRFEVTTRCNYNCVICPHHKITRKVETMSLRLFKGLFDKITAETGQYDTLTFPGMGEPLLDPTLDDKIGYAVKRRNGLSIMLLTNASLLTVERFRRLEALGVASVRVSFYGNDPESYSRAHGVKDKELFNRIKGNLLEISGMRKKTKLLLTYNVIDGVNEKAVNAWIRLWRGRCDLFEVWRPHNWVDGKRCRKVQKNKLRTCGRPFTSPLQVQVDGTVNMCCFDFDGKLTLGDLKKQPLKEIFTSPLYRKIARCHSTGDFAGSRLICSRCDQRNADKGDVMLYNSKFDIRERVNMTSTVYSRLVPPPDVSISTPCIDGTGFAPNEEKPPDFKRRSII